MPDASATSPHPPLPVRLFATGLGAGYAPAAPGTAGSLLALAVYWLPGFSDPLVLGLSTAAVLILGALASGAMERHYGEDPPIVVIDEVAGMWVSLLFLPRTLVVSAAGFVLFRIFDIFKPPPARRAERIGGGAGIMLDDVVAGVYANVALRILLALL